MRHSKILYAYFFSLSFGTLAPLSSENAPELDHAIVSMYAVDTKSGEVLIDQNSDLSLVPSSCMKIVTTGAALQLLGPEFRFETQLEYDGVIDGSKALIGNLYIKGGGDPCLGSDRIAGSLGWKKQIEAWVDAVQKAGIHKIEGRVIGVAKNWETALAVPSWSWEDLGNYYGAGACGLSFHENSYALTFKPGKRPGEKTAILATDPPLPTVTLQNEVLTGPEGSGDKACIYGSEFSSTQYVRGTVPAGVTEFTIKGAIPDPASTCAEILAKALQEKGISIAKQELMEQTKKTSLHTTYSPPLKEIVQQTNQMSINLYAEHLLKKIGEIAYRNGSTASGIKAVTEFWKTQGIDLNGFHMADGSGLSRKNLITAKQLVAILQKMKKTEEFSFFFDSLPKQIGTIRAKPGSMSLIKGYAGYSEEVAFAILVNQCPNVNALEKKTDLFLSDVSKKKLSEYKRL